MFCKATTKVVNLKLLSENKSKELEGKSMRVDFVKCDNGEILWKIVKFSKVK